MKAGVQPDRMGARELTSTALPLSPLSQPTHPDLVTIPPPAQRNLLSLPADVLREILGHVLAADDARRANVLRVSSVWLELGRPLLLRHVRLATIGQWEAMFGPGGYLSTVESGGKGYGRWVRELELDRTEISDADWFFPVSKYISLPFLHTLTLSHHLIETWTTNPSLPLDSTDPDAPVSTHHHHHIPCTLFASIFVQLPTITTLIYLTPLPRALWEGNPASSGRDLEHSRQPISTLLGLSGPCSLSFPEITTPNPIGPFPWPNLRTIRFVGGLALDDPREDEPAARAMAFFQLPMVSLLVVDYDHKYVQAPKPKMKTFLRVFMRGERDEEVRSRWREVKRVEVRGLGGGPRLMESRIRTSWRNAVGKPSGGDEVWTEEEKRFGERVVFVDQDGGERRLVEE